MEKNAPLYNGSYLGSDLNRLYSYKHQIEIALSFSPKTVAVIGVGDGFVRDVLKSNGIDVCSIDIDKKLCPDVCCDITSLPINDDTFEVSICCQVLEHIPFDLVGKALAELKRITSGPVILSLPDIRRFASLRIQLPILKKIELQCSLPRLVKPDFDPTRTKTMGHHWEIGFKRYSFGHVSSLIRQSGFEIKKSFRVNDMSWHTFFVCIP